MSFRRKVCPADVRWSAAIDLNMDELPDHLVPPAGCLACSGAFVACALGPELPPPLPRAPGRTDRLSRRQWAALSDAELKATLRLARALLLPPRTSFRPREAMLLCCEGHVTIVDDADGKAGTLYELPTFGFDGLFDR